MQMNHFTGLSWQFHTCEELIVRLSDIRQVLTNYGLSLKLLQNIIRAW